MRTDPKADSESPQLVEFSFSEFSGGMRRNVDPGYLKDNEYPLLINGRSRYGAIRPVKLPSKYETVLGTKYQTLFSRNKILYVYADGVCYSINPFAGTTFRKVIGADLDSSVDEIYTENVPDSSFDFDRIPNTQNANGGVDRRTPIAASNSGIICQDGINRPKLILSASSARTLQDFSLWSLQGTREYVPVGLNMLYHDGILYIVSQDRQDIYRSVTGRPLDFVIAVSTPLGDKLSDSLFDIEAKRMSHKVSYNSITALGPLNTAPPYPAFGAPFFVSTTKGTWKVMPDFETTFFAEPSFKNIPLFNATILDQQAFVFSAGDTQFIDWTGLRSINAVEQSLIVSKDTALSGSIYKILEGVKQELSCCTYFDDYTLFACQTIYGPAVIVYDNLRQKFDALDIFPGVGTIRKFATVERKGEKRLFFITDDALYEYFGSSTTAECSLYIKECQPSDAEHELILQRVKLAFNNVEESGIVYAMPIIDRYNGPTLSSTIEVNFTNTPGSATIPFGNVLGTTVENRTFAFQQLRMGDKVCLMVKFNFMADFEGIQLYAKNVLSTVSYGQQKLLYK